MNSLRQFQLFRGLTLQVLEDLEETKWDAQHPGQPNTICWNTGHLYITSEFLMNKTDHHYKVHQPEWSAFFAPGTRPSE
ncbi:DinB family protein [Siminovitchia sp. FSL W7-1587]|uniref:DinB family protein n=1 Tax=Siminovitchia sp. FSL W7-1587 TaxID=2954699 RepID=UPI0030CF512C